MQIKDIFYEGRWHWEKLATQIPDHIKFCMQSLFLDGVSDDVLIWGNSHSGLYSASSAYHWISNNQTTRFQYSDSWSWLWQLHLPENIKHFLWLTLHGSPPTNSFRHYRHLCTDLSCQRCGSHEETSIHALRDCNSSSRIWCLIVFSRGQNFYSPNCNQWLKENICSEHGILFAVTCWILWKS